MLSPIQTAIAAIKTAPRSLNGGVYWMADPTLMAKVAVAIIGSGDTLAAMKEITDATGVNSPTMRLFIRGMDAQQKPCQVILDGLKAAGLRPVAYTTRHNGWYGRKSISADGQRANQQGKTEHLTAPEHRVEQAQAESDDANNFRAALKSARTTKGMTHENLGSAMSPPVSGALIWRWENTSLQPNVSQIQSLCRALQISVGSLLRLKAPSRFIYEGAHDGADYRVYINDETKDVRVSFCYKFESKSWCNVMAFINSPKP